MKPSNHGLTLRIKAVWLFLAIGIIASTSQGGPPSWEKVASTVYLTFEHIQTTATSGNDYAGGIWAFDPISLEGQRIRHLDADECHPPVYLGQDLQLVTNNGLLVVQTWPTELLFEPGSWRLVGRRPTTPAQSLLADTFDEPNAHSNFGWTLLGPILNSRDLEGTGLEVGIFGIPECIRSVVTSYDSGWGGLSSISCVEFGNESVIGEGPFLMRSSTVPPDPFSADLIRTLPDHAFTNALPQLSWDRDRQGLWYPIRDDDGPVSIALYPAREGQILEPEMGLGLDLDIPPGFSLNLDIMHYDSNSHGLLIHGTVIDPNDPLSTTTLSVMADASSLDPLGEVGSHDMVMNPIASWIPKFPAWGSTQNCPSPGAELVDATPVSATSFRNKPEELTQLVPVIAEAPGRHNIDWHTDLWFFNPSEEPMPVRIERLSTGEETVFNLEPHASRQISNVLSWLGGGPSGDGRTHDALFVSSTFRFGKQLRIDGRIWTADLASGGTFGHALQAIPAPFGYSNHAQYTPGFSGELYAVQPEFQQVSAFVQLDHRQTGRFRHNLGIVNPYDEVLEIGLLWGYDDVLVWTWQQETGAPVENKYPSEAKVLLEIPPKSVQIFDLPALFPSEVANIFPARVAVLGNRAAPIWFSMIDETTQDATFVPFTIYQLPALKYEERRPGNPDGTPWSPDFLVFENSYRMAIPAVAHTSGLNGSQWTTTLYGYRHPANSIEHPSGPIAALHPGSETRCSVNQAQYLKGILESNHEDFESFLENQDSGYEPDYFRTIHPDVIRLFDGCHEAEDVQGGLEIVTGSWFSGFSRTFTTRDDGGTYGGMLPLYPAGGWPVQHFAGIEVSPDTRINLGFFNGDHDHDIIHRISLYDASGGLTAEREFVLDSLDSRQMELHDFFEGINLAEGTYGLTVLPLDGAEADGTPFQGHSWAYVSIIDNRTNDPINLW